MIGAYFLARGSLGARVRPWSLAAASLSIGLAVGGRPPLIAEGLLLIGALYLIVRRDPRRDWERLLHFGAILLAPFAAIVLILFAYNYARFGSFLQYGVSYTLAGADFSKLPTPSLTYLAPGLYSYLVSPVRWTFSFPYFAVPPPPAYPGSVPSYYYFELTGGLLTTTPIVVATAVAAPILWRKQRQLVAVMLALVGAGAVAVLLSAVSLWETTMRYEADFATFFLIPGLLAWFALSQRKRGRVLGVVGAVLVLYGALVGAAISLTGYYDDLRTVSPGSYWALARATSFAPTLLTMIEGHPVIARAFNPFGMTNGNEDTYQLGTTTFHLSPLPVEVDIISPDNGSWSLSPTFQRIPNNGYPCCFEGFFVDRNAPSDVFVVSNGTTERFPLGSQPRGVVIPLRRGLNRIELLAGARGLYSQSGAVALADGLRISSELPPTRPASR
jgi:hypothetical protein